MPKYRPQALRIIEAHSPSEWISYKPVDYQPTAEVGRLIKANQFTYVKVKMGRDTDQIYALYDLALTPDLAKVSWLPMPFPQPGQIRPRLSVSGK